TLVVGDVTWTLPDTTTVTKAADDTVTGVLPDSTSVSGSILDDGSLSVTLPDDGTLRVAPDSSVQQLENDGTTLVYKLDIAGTRSDYVSGVIHLVTSADTSIDTYDPEGELTLHVNSDGSSIVHQFDGSQVSKSAGDTITAVIAFDGTAATVQSDSTWLA